MMSAFRYRDAYPNNKNQAPIPYYPPPGLGVHMDPSMRYSGYGQPWPYAGDWGYPNPWRSCCSHSSFPNPPPMHYGPPYPHFPASAPAYCCGSYPAYHEFHPVPYASLNYSHGLPRYEYDKHVPAEHHCCGCPNHPCNKRDGRTPKIEEKEPDVEEKGDKSIMPIEWRNYPYPVVWLPPNYKSSMEQPKPIEQNEEDKTSVNVQPAELKVKGQEPRIWNRWFPFNIKNPSEFNLSEERNESHDQRSEQTKDFSYPVFWMPNYDMQGEGGSMENQERNPRATDQQPCTWKFVPINLSDSYGSESKPLQSEDKIDNGGVSDVREKPGSQKLVPVKHAEPPQRKDGSGDCERRENGGKIEKRGAMDVGKTPGCQKIIPVQGAEPLKTEDGTRDSHRQEKMDLNVKKLEETTENKSSGTDSKRQSPSSPKTSRLPPVCLRIDPLPKKKRGNRSSRSPDLPASKECSQDIGTSKGSLLPHPKDKAHGDSKLIESTCRNEVEPKEKNIEVSDKRADKNIGGVNNDPSETENPSDLLNAAQDNNSNVDDSARTYKDGVKQAAQENKEVKTETTSEENVKANAIQDTSKLTSDRDEKKRRVLSETNAAVTIQSAFRGYVVRKWEPLKKLQLIAKIRDRMMDLKNCIQTLESSADIGKDRKEITVLAEMIMKLLLDLDTIQGLHPCFRETRKSMARELISLQEKLDDLALREADGHTQEHPFVKPLDSDDRDVQPKKAEEVTEFKNNIREDASFCSNGLLLPTNSQGCMLKTRSGSEHEVENGSIVDKIPDKLPATSNDGDAGNTTAINVDSNDLEVTTQKIKQCEVEEMQVGNFGKEFPDSNPGEDMQMAVENDACPREFSVISAEGHSSVTDENMAAEVDKIDVDLSAQLPAAAVLHTHTKSTSNEGAGNADLTTIPQENGQSNMNVLVELPGVILDEDSAVPEFAKHKEVENTEFTLQPEEKGPLDVDLSAELPVALLDEELAIPESAEQATENSEMTLLAEEKMLNMEMEACYPAELTSSETLEEKSLEEVRGLQSSVESDGWLNVEWREELHGDLSLNIGADDKGVSDMSGPTTIERSPLSHRTYCHESGSQVTSVPLAATQFALNASEEMQTNAVKEGEGVPKVVMVVDKDEAKDNILLQGPDFAIEPVAAGSAASDDFLHKLVPEREMVAPENAVDSNATGLEAEKQEESELPILTPAALKHSSSGINRDFDSEKKLTEENEKLRDLMAQLIDAGKNQLAEISNLTGKVKELEKKLARKRRTKARHGRSLAARSACAKPPSTNALRA